MKLASISSGSKGNCILVESKNTSILVDAGISKKRIEEGLDYFCKTPNKIDGIVVTHEHSDHIKGLGVLLRKYNIPVYGTEKTIEYILNCPALGKIDSELFQVIRPEQNFTIKDMDLHPIHISHDAVDPVCYKFIDHDKSCAVVTDLGFYEQHLVGELQELNAILIESNHDINMLQTGPYPYALKQRIWGDRGHLSNESCGRLINEIISEKLQHIVLGHLSQENNYPDLAYEAVRNEINISSTEFRADDIDIKVASRSRPSCLVEF